MAENTPRHPVIVLFQFDLRSHDHPALRAAADADAPVVPLYVLDDAAAGPWALGGASRWWLHHSLQALSENFETAGSPLIIRQGDVCEHVCEIAEAIDARAVHFSRGSEPWWRKVEDRLKSELADRDIAAKRFAGRLLIDPDKVRTNSGDVYKVYTPFWRAVSQKDLRAPVAQVRKLEAPSEKIASDALEDLNLLPRRPNWAESFGPHWTPGETGARRRLRAFLDDDLDSYGQDRDRPDRAGTSRLSPHLRFGEISAAECWTQVQNVLADRTCAGAETFLKELMWREFSYHLLHEWPDLPEAAFRAQFGQFPWREDDDQLRAWQKGQTGYPIVDAGMRELWQTGWMHNRVRMIVGSFLTKNLLLPWQAGEAWFWDCLVDADLASNAASWQWVAGSGADAAPYFRIFNPIKQGEKHDPDGAYVRRWVPELADLPNNAIHAPWEAGKDVLKTAGVVLGETYPAPIVDHGETRKRALDAYERIKG